MARHQQADLVACTRKDAVKWPQIDWPIPVVIVDCQLQILEGHANIDSIVDKARQAVATRNYD